MGKRQWVGIVIAALVAASCSGSDDSSTDDTAPTTPPSATDAADNTPTAEPDDSAPTTDETPIGDSGGGVVEIDQPIDAEVRPGVEQIALLDATPGTEFVLVPDDDFDATFAAGVADEYGSLVVRGLDADVDYRVGDGSVVGVPIDVFGRDEHPDPSFFAEQRLELNREGNSGFDYVETRDGTTLGAYVVLPGPVEDGPYPTVVEYSGYSPSNPEQGAGFATLFQSLGYAYVGVNVRGTGCSGGSFQFFEYTQSTDGYDVVEAVAAQPWVAGNTVGMVGISYPGISQLFVAQTQPPSLDAITPLSVNDDTYQGTLYPGGILNTGFAASWGAERFDSARPSIDPMGDPTGAGQDWTVDQIATGDEQCAANQGVRLQNPDTSAQIRATEFYIPSVGDDISPRLFVDKIEVPTFLAGAWQDEQTGGRFPTMLDRFTGTDRFYATMVNGLHTESISPAVLPRMLEFLDLYVAKRTPDLAPARAVAPILAAGIWGTDEVGEIPDRFAGLAYADALAAFEAEAPIEILFEQGAADDSTPLAPLARFSERFDAWPIPSTEPTVWHLGPDTLTPEPVADDSRVDYLAVPDNAPATYWTGNSSDLWRTDVVWDWQEPAPGTYADFRSAPLTETLTMVGSGSADLWVASSTGDTDLEVTLTELRPDGTEVLVQSGWLRASHRALDEDASTDLRPVQTHLEADAAPLPDSADGGPDAFELARVEIFPFAHVFRAGSQIRLMVDAPGGNRAVWEFDTISNGEQVQIGVGPSTPSRLVLPVIPDIEPPAAYPPCDSLRGQPCR
jgi:predicted acyl esterase